MISETKTQVLKLFHEGRQLYIAQNFAGAMEKFANARELDPSDGPSQVFLDRCRLYIGNPPPEDWDGVFEMKTK